VNIVDNVLGEDVFGLITLFLRLVKDTRNQR